MKPENGPHTKPTSLWPYSIIATFVVFISALAAYVTFACSNDVELVATDYYQQEIEYERQMDRLKRTQSLVGQIKVVQVPGSKQLKLQLPRPHATPELKGNVQFYYPADGREDQHFPLKLTPEGVQEFDLSDLHRGFWRMKVRWTYASEDYHFEQEFQSYETQLALH